MMGTRLWMEHVVREHLPQLRYVRIQNAGSHKAVIYAWDDQLRLQEADAAKLMRFSADYLPQDVCFTVKPYSAAPEDGVYPCEVPEPLRKAAMNGSLDQTAVFAVLNSLFSGIILAYRRYDLRTGTVHMAAYSYTTIGKKDREVIQKYADELMPVGSTAEVFYYGS